MDDDKGDRRRLQNHDKDDDDGLEMGRRWDLDVHAVTHMTSSKYVETF